MHCRYFLVFPLLITLACLPKSQSKIAALGGTTATENKVFLPLGPIQLMSHEKIVTVVERLGLKQAAQPGPHDGKCLSCHADLRTQKFLDNLYYNAIAIQDRCLKTKPTTKEQAAAAIHCMGQNFTGAEGARALNPHQLGFFSASLSHPFFVELFQLADQSTVYDELVKSVRMPLGGEPFPQQDIELIWSWLVSGMPESNLYLKSDGPQSCLNANESFIGSNVKSYIQRMSVGGEGWTGVNQKNGLKMFACTSNKTAECFNGKDANGKDIFPLYPAWNQPGLKANIRRVTEFAKPMDFWIRSSADGRFVAGGGSPSFVLDMAPQLDGKSPRRIEVAADYDPGFLPNNQGIIFQGNGTRMCRQTVLDDPKLKMLDFTQAECGTKNLNVGLYQGIGSSLESGDMITVSGSFLGDDGAGRLTNQPPQFVVGDGAQVKIFNFADWSLKQEITLNAPFHGNWNISPTHHLLLSVISGADQEQHPIHGGYHLTYIPDYSKLAATVDMKSISRDDTALICTGGGEKSSFSLSDRFIVFYRYNQAFLPNDDNKAGSADIFVIDLLGDLKPKQLTHMPTGFYAQFPHFRSDGWLYFLVRDMIGDKRYLMATDGVLNLQ